MHVYWKGDKPVDRRQRVQCPAVQAGFMPASPSLLYTSRKRIVLHSFVTLSSTLFQSLSLHISSIFLAMSASAIGENVASNDLEMLTQRMALELDPSRAVELLEENFKDDFLGIWNVDLMKSYIRKRGSKMEVNGVQLYYETVGTGPHVVLMCPGTPGTIASDFLPQMLPGGFDRGKFTLVSFEPRGYGGSTPPKRTTFQHGYQIQDAEDAVTLMEKLGHKRFSWIGWCAGGNIGIVAAALYPDRLRGLVAWGAYPVITEKAFKIAAMFESVDQWSEKMLAPKLLEYEKEYLQFLFSQLFKYKMWVYENNNGDCVKSYLPRVQCPTLVMWLKEDVLTEREQADVMLQLVPNAKLHVVEDGKHAFHLKSPARFRAIVEEFLSTAP